MPTPKVEAKMEKITPAKAKRYLANSNHGNRKLRPSRVEQYARDMVTDRWRFTGDAIRFNGDDTLIDGQHRLAAVVEAGVTVQMLVIRGLEDEAKTHIDTGAKRSFSDVLHYEGFSKNRAGLGAAIRWCLMYESGYVTQIRLYAQGSGTFQPTNSELLAWLYDNPGIIESVDRTIARKANFRAVLTILGVIDFYAHQAGRGEDALYFREALENGAGLEEGNAILAVRNFLTYSQIRNARLHDTKSSHAVTVKGWNTWLAGDSVKHLSFRSGGARPEAFPQIMYAPNPKDPNA